MIKWRENNPKFRSGSAYVEYISYCKSFLKYQCSDGSWRIMCEYGQEIGLGDTKVRNIRYEDQADLIAEGLRSIKERGGYIE